MPFPRILFSSAAFFGRPLAETMSLVAETGYAGVEVMVTKDPESQDPDRIRQLADEHGLEIGALHAPCLLITRRVWGTDPVRKLHRAVQVAARAGIPLVVTHPPYRWQRTYRARLAERLDEVGGDVTIAIETMFPLGMGGRGFMVHADQELDGPATWPVVLDTSHVAVSGDDLLDVTRRLGPRLRHVHLSDNAGKGWDSHLPPGEGVLPIDAFLDGLAGDGFAGDVTIEVDLRRYVADEQRLREVMVQMRERCDARLRPRTG